MKNNWIAGLIGAGLALATVALVSSSTDDVHPVEARPRQLLSLLNCQKPSPLQAMPLERLDVQESLDREILVNSYWQSNNLLMLKRSDKWFVIEPIPQRTRHSRRLQIPRTHRERIARYCEPSWRCRTLADHEIHWA